MSGHARCLAKTGGKTKKQDYLKKSIEFRRLFLMSMDIPKIALVGARGIPTSYGGCETFAEELSQRLTSMGFEIYVTCNSHRYYTDKYNDVIRIHTPPSKERLLRYPPSMKFSTLSTFSRNIPMSR